jgi:HK97 family phage major capsid protein
MTTDSERTLLEQLHELEDEAHGQPFDEAQKARWNDLNAELDEYRVRRERLIELARDPRNTEAGSVYETKLTRTRFDEAAPEHVRAAHDDGLRAIERNRHLLSPAAGDRLDELVRLQDRSGIDARYLAAVSDPHYLSAFGKLVADPTHGHLRYSQPEVAAVQRVSGVMFERAMNIGTGSAGGFGVPFTLDPSILLTSSGALNPVRSVARVITISTDQWKGVSSTGVTAAYQAEAAETADASPVLAQPTIDCAMGRAFIPFSYELGQDWGSLQQELTRLISDGKDVLDATQFLTGTGTDSPAGVLTGLTTSQRVQCAATGFPAVADHYSLKAAVPARFLANLSWMAHQGQWDRSYRLTPVGSTTEPQMLVTREGAMLGAPKNEWSTMANVATAGSKVIIAGDFQAAFTIADRIGMTVELVPTLFGPTQRPTGQRGLLAFWRTGSKVVVPEALRYLETI